jgi:FMN phosphatase YigB (HAD superfamily)
MKDADKGHSIVKLTGVAPEAPAQAVRGDFDRSDLEMIRVYEDLMDILMAKRIILLTDFPQAAQEKIVKRKKLRASLAPITGMFSADEEGIGLI